MRLLLVFTILLHTKRATDRIWTGDLILTKDALYQLSYCSLCLFRSAWRSLCRRPFSSGRRGSNPPPIAWKAIALPNELLPLLCRFVGKSGLEPLNSEEDRFTVCCNCHYATSPLIPMPFWHSKDRADEGTRTPDRLITNQLLYQLSYIGFSMFQTTLFSWFEVAKILLFHKLKNIFSTFLQTFLQYIWFST